MCFQRAGGCIFCCGEAFRIGRFAGWFNAKWFFSLLSGFSVYGSSICSDALRFCCMMG